MTREQIITVKKSWRLFRQVSPQLLGGVFYEKLFAEHPNLRRMFRTPIDTQSEKLVDMLNVIVFHLDKLDTLSDEVEGLAQRHLSYGVKREHYRYVGDALAWTIRQGLGNDWNEEVEAAWKACYDHLSGLMLGTLKTG